jgi:D-sedoheptulose 7-phosphate isomerase
MKTVISDAIEIHKKLLAEFESSSPDILRKMASLIADAFESRNCLYICGNGGSAADAQHIAGEFVGRFRKERKALPAVALTTDTSVLTCIGNDYAFSDVFARQIEALVKPADILWAFSTSGNSPNVVDAVQLAKTKGAKILAFTGKTNSRLENIADVCLCVPSPTASGAQEIHQLAYHIICDIVEQKICRTI